MHWRKQTTTQLLAHTHAHVHTQTHTHFKVQVSNSVWENTSYNLVWAHPCIAPESKYGPEVANDREKAFTNFMCRQYK